MLEYMHANGFNAAYDALKSDTSTEYTPDPKARFAGLLEKKWTSVIRLQKKVCAFIRPCRRCNHDLARC
jgi:platelet-activating factor acetylhydrolase IB subunit alpha